MNLVTKTKDKILTVSSHPLGFFRDEKMSDYHFSEALSRSGLWTLHSKSPLAFKAQRSSPPKETLAMSLGTAFHTLFEGKFFDHYAISTGVRKNTKAYREFASQHPGKIIIKREDYNTIVKMKKSAMGLDFVEGFLSKKPYHEPSFYWRDKQSAQIMKCRPDVLSQDFRIIIDLKTTSKYPKSGNLRSQFFADGYHVSVAMSVDGVEAVTGVKPKYYFLYVHTEPPYEATLVQATSEQEILGRHIYKNASLIYKRCTEEDHFPGIDQEQQSFGLSYFARKELEMFEEHSTWAS